MNKTAIILITKNRQKLLKQTIRSLFANTPRASFDLIVVDDGSDDVSYLLECNQAGMISDLVLTNFGSPSRCRNIGAEIARKKGYEFLYHTDNDMYFLPGWLEECHTIKNDNNIIKIIGAYCHPFMQKNADESMLDDHFIKGVTFSEFETVDAVSGNSWFISTEDYFKYGLHETDGIMASEDWEMCQRIRKDGNFVVRLTPHKVLHCGITNSRGEASVGADIMLEELSQAKVKYNLDIYYD
jgi:glycosyltransferase involved in cell wall biosynthesis